MSDKKVFHGSDIYMLAKTMILLCGGKVDGDIFYPKTFSPLFKAFFKSLLIKNPFRRYQSCGEVYDQFHDILIQTFGKPKFAEFGQ